ncbi:MAG: glutamyl-tRNA reductase [Coriobacteriia bacterium]|nr:glutamyl-tRNA reductase [Coriobacteriia bacterium]
MHLTVVGLSHKTAPIEIREKLTFPESIQADALSLLVSKDEVAEAVILSTCNRTEIYAVTRDACNGFEVVAEFMAGYHNLDLCEIKKYLYHHQDMKMVGHLFRVVSSLESMVLGEAQILGQIKEAYGFASSNGATDRIFNKLFRQSFELGKRVRSETGIGESAVSISYAAVELARRVFDALEGRTILIVGAGKMSELTAKHLVSQGVGSVLVANRTYEKACEIAELFEGEAIRYEELFAHMRNADIVISSTAAPGYVITKDEVAKARKGVRGKALFLIDIALPRDIDPAVHELNDVYLYDIDDLNGVVDANLEERKREAVRAEEIIVEETNSFSQWIETLIVEPTIAQIRAKAEGIRDDEVAKAMKRLGNLDDTDKAVVDAMANALVNKLLHGPTMRLKAGAAEDNSYERVETARFLYGLDINPDEKPRHRGLIRNLLGKSAEDFPQPKRHHHASAQPATATTAPQLPTEQETSSEANQEVGDNTPTTSPAPKRGA